MSSIVTIPSRPKVRASKDFPGVFTQKVPSFTSSLRRSAEAMRELQIKDFADGDKDFAKEVAEEIREITSEKYQKGEEHSKLSREILTSLGVRDIREGIDAATRASHKGERLPEPPANEPILIRRVTVPPEGLFLEEAVDKVPYVNRCLNIKALNIGSVPIRAMRRQQGDLPAKSDDETPEARRLLRLIERPNAHMSGTDLIEAISFWINIRQALVWMMWDPARERTKPEEAKKIGLPSALYCLPAHRSVGMMWEGSLLYYRVTGAGGLSIPAWQVIRIGFYNPKEEFRCLSPLSAAYQSADTDYAMDLYNSNFFENGLKLSGVISLKGNVSEEKRRTYENLVQQFVGVGNDHAVLVLDQEATFQSMVSGTKDMDYKGLGDLNKSKITGSFGVPRAMLGDMEGSRSLASATVARKSFWQDTEVPELRKIIDKLNVHLVPYAGDGDVYLEPDFSKIEALADNRTEFATAFLKVSQALVALNGIGAVNQEDNASILESRFGVEVQGETPEDTYEEDEEILAESASVILIKRLKNLVASRLQLDPSLRMNLVPKPSVEKLAIGYGMKPDAAREFAEKLSVEVCAFGRDKEKIRQYFDGLKILAEKRVRR